MWNFIEECMTVVVTVLQIRNDLVGEVGGALSMARGGWVGGPGRAVTRVRGGVIFVLREILTAVEVLLVNTLAVVEEHRIKRGLELGFLNLLVLLLVQLLSLPLLLLVNCWKENISV